jgi:hypothetical protein
MATCPHCKEFLDEGHVCPGRGMRVVWDVVSMTLGVAVGAALGAAFFLLVGNLVGRPDLELAGLILGALVGFVITRSVRNW